MTRGCRRSRRATRASYRPCRSRDEGHPKEGVPTLASTDDGLLAEGSIALAVLDAILALPKALLRLRHRWVGLALTSSLALLTIEILGVRPVGAQWAIVLGWAALVWASLRRRDRSRERRAEQRRALEAELLQRCGLRPYPGQTDDAIRWQIDRFLNQPLLERVDAATRPPEDN